jgi:hypothetical protein
VAVKQLIQCVALCAGGLLAAGCGGGGADQLPRVAASGKVTVDGMPIPFAEILMEGKPDKTGQGAKSTIYAKGGEFEIDADRGPAPGENSVTVIIYSAEPPPPNPDGEGDEPEIIGTYQGTVLVEEGNPITLDIAKAELTK